MSCTALYGSAAVALFDDKTRELKHLIKDPEIVTPTGKFNVYSTLNNVY